MKLKEYILSKISIFGGKPAKEPRTIKMWEHTSWGDSIRFHNFEYRLLTGFMGNTPEVGDYVISKMESGNLFKFVVVEVERAQGVRDQFFARVKDVGYC